MLPYYLKSISLGRWEVFVVGLLFVVYVERLQYIEYKCIVIFVGNFLDEIVMHSIII